jgi:hypothetical protein
MTPPTHDKRSVLMSCRSEDCDNSQWIHDGILATIHGWTFTTDTGWLCPQCSGHEPSLQELGAGP